MIPARLLVAEDETSVRETLEAHLTELGYDVLAVDSATSALSRISAFNPDLVLSDVQMPGMTGFELMAKLQEVRPQTDVVIFTGHADVGGAIRAMKSGAVDYLIKPLDLDETEGVIKRALSKRKCLSDTCASAEGGEVTASFGMVGRHSNIIQVYKAIGSVAETDATVLIQGETGTGKELVAKAIHDASHRAAAPFVAMNCAAVPSELLESELFGHVRGAFTGAGTDRRGKFDAANGGTLFLDEIGDTTPEFQAKLLRVLQEGEYYPVGGDRPRQTDARIVTATHRGLCGMVEEGTFREDLLYRLQVIVIPVPSLRHRRSDIPLLVRYLLAQAAAKTGKTPPVVPEEVMEDLIWREWPGNVRELENTVTRALIMSRGPALTLTDIRADGFAPSAEDHEAAQGQEQPTEADLLGQAVSLSDVRSSVEREHVRRVLEDTHGNKSEAARVLQISRPTLNRIIEDHHLATG